MAITQAMCDSFKVQILSGQQNLVSGSSQTYKLALYTSSATLSNATTAYTTVNEVTSSGSNYTAGGNTLTVSTSPTSTGNVAFMSFANTSWTNANISAAGALIYNSTANTYKSLAVSKIWCLVLPRLINSLCIQAQQH